MSFRFPIFRSTIPFLFGVLATAGAEAAPPRIQLAEPVLVKPSAAAALSAKTIRPELRAAAAEELATKADPIGRGSVERPPVRLPERGDAPVVSPADDGCRDPQATDLTVSGISRNGDGTWQFSLRGTVTNGGDAAFESRPNQQSAGLYEGSNRRAVAHFTNLRPGQRVNTAFTRITRWYTGQEFHSGFQLRVDYDPDIFIDGNLRNDDCQLRNNTRVLSAAEIDAILLGSGR